MSDIPWSDLGTSVSESIVVKETGALLKVLIQEILLYTSQDDEFLVDQYVEIINPLGEVLLALEGLVDRKIISEVEAPDIVSRKYSEASFYRYSI